MKYKAAHRTLRLKDLIDKQDLNYMPNSYNSSLNKTVERAEKKDPKAVDNLTKQIYRAILPSLHEKTFFKSVNSFYTEHSKRQFAHSFERKE